MVKEGRSRTVIEDVHPCVDGGRYAAKHVAGRPLSVRANVFCDGHDLVAAELAYRRIEPEKDAKYHTLAMTPGANDLCAASFIPEESGLWEFTISSWVDHPATLCRAISRKHAAAVDYTLDAHELAELCGTAASRAPGSKGNEAKAAKRVLTEAQSVFGACAPNQPSDEAARLAGDGKLADALFAYAPRRWPTQLTKALQVRVDRQRAGFSAWYELFPRSTGAGTRHGTFLTVIERLPYIRDLGFDIVYFPPVHPIGTMHRKGRNNSLHPGPDDPGSPWAIGSSLGGHTSVHPELGTIDDFNELVDAVRAHGMETALDIAFQCAPDHPWVTEHPEWFNIRPDGSIAYAENPPKKYEDIYPLNFESDDWQGLWQALRDVFVFWIERGVRVFRVDNPHTKAFAFWEWCIADLKAQWPDLIFLSEAFARPNVMYQLSKLGFTHGYTYFTWRTSPAEFRDYMTELTSPPVSEFFRPNFWPNTPDILHEVLQTGGRPAFIARLVLASTLSSNYGMYGPAYELLEHVPREPGSEEYLHSEKYEIRNWDLNAPHSIRDIVAVINRLRRHHPALQRNDGLVFHACDNPDLLCYSKIDRERGDLVFVVVNFDFANTQGGWVEFSPAAFDLGPVGPVGLKDAMTQDEYIWRERWNFVMLDPNKMPVHVFTTNIPGFTRIRTTQ